MKLLLSSSPLRSGHGFCEPMLRSADWIQCMMQIPEVSWNVWTSAPRGKHRATKSPEDAFSLKSCRNPIRRAPGFSLQLHWSWFTGLVTTDQQLPGPLLRPREWTKQLPRGSVAVKSDRPGTESRIQHLRELSGFSEWQIPHLLRGSKTSFESCGRTENNRVHKGKVWLFFRIQVTFLVGKTIYIN